MNSRNQFPQNFQQENDEETFDPNDRAQFIQKMHNDVYLVMLKTVLEKSSKTCFMKCFPTTKKSNLKLNDSDRKCLNSCLSLWVDSSEIVQRILMESINEKTESMSEQINSKK